MADEPTDGSEDELMAGVVVAVDGGWSVGALPPLPTPSSDKHWQAAWGCAQQSATRAARKSVHQARLREADGSSKDLQKNHHHAVRERIVRICVELGSHVR